MASVDDLAKIDDLTKNVDKAESLVAESFGFRF